MADWVFTQLSGEKKILTLAGWSAPFGRPRQRSVVRDGESVRVKSTRYPGVNGSLTRHVFGINYHDFELGGRFRDRELGKGGAKSKVEEVKSFLHDMQRCDISWGDNIHVTGLISEFDPGRESPAEIEWKMKILIDQDNMTLSQSNPVKGADPGGIVDAVALGLTNAMSIPSTPNLGIQTSFLDALDDLVSSITGALGQLNNIANQISNFEQGLASAANKLIAGIHQLKTAVLTFMATLASAENDSFFVRDSAEDTINYQETVKAARTQALIAMALLSDLENQATASLQGEAKLTARVQDGDSWESISARYFGSSFEANDIRKANGVRFGKKPTPGEVIIIPKK